MRANLIDEQYCTLVLSAAQAYNAQYTTKLSSDGMYTLWVILSVLRNDILFQIVYPFFVFDTYILNSAHNVHILKHYGTWESLF